MRFNKSDFMIVRKKKKNYHILIKSKFLFIFERWLILTAQDTENTEPYPIEFKTFKEANEFIENFVN